MLLNIITFLKELVNFIDTHSTLILAIVTIMYTILTYNLSKQTINERRYQYLQKRLEFVYYPLREIFSSDFDISIWFKPEGRQFVHIQIMKTKRPIIITSRNINEMFEEVKPYLYMSPPIFKRKIDFWAQRVSDIEYSDKCWSEEEVSYIVPELRNCIEDILANINEYIEKDETELYYMVNGKQKRYLIMLLGAIFFTVGFWLLLNV